MCGVTAQTLKQQLREAVDKIDVYVSNGTGFEENIILSMCTFSNIKLLLDYIDDLERRTEADTVKGAI